jgi:hypothetical protein
VVKTIGYGPIEIIGSTPISACLNELKFMSTYLRDYYQSQNHQVFRAQQFCFEFEYTDLNISMETFKSIFLSLDCCKNASLFVTVLIVRVETIGVGVAFFVYARFAKPARYSNLCFKCLDCIPVYVTVTNRVTIVKALLSFKSKKDDIFSNRPLYWWEEFVKIPNLKPFPSYTPSL